MVMVAVLVLVLVAVLPLLLLMMLMVMARQTAKLLALLVGDLFLLVKKSPPAAY